MITHDTTAPEAGQHLPFFDRSFLNPRFLLRIDEAVAASVDHETRTALRNLFLIDRAAELARQAMMGNVRAEDSLRTLIASWIRRPVISSAHPTHVSGAVGNDVVEDSLRHLYTSGPVLDIAFAAVRLSIGDKKCMCELLEAVIALVESVALRAAAVANALALGRSLPELRRILWAGVSAAQVSALSVPRSNDEVGPRHMTLAALFDVLRALQGWKEDNVQLRYFQLTAPRILQSAREVNVSEDFDRTLALEADPAEAIWCGNTLLLSHDANGQNHAVVPAFRSGRLLAARRLNEQELVALEKAHHADGHVSPLGWAEALAGRIHLSNLAPPTAGSGIVVPPFGWRFQRFDVYDQQQNLVGGLGRQAVELDLAASYRVRWAIIGNGTNLPISGDELVLSGSSRWRELFENPFARKLILWPRISLIRIRACVRRGLRASFRLGAADGTVRLTTTPTPPEGAILGLREEAGELLLDVYVDLGAPDALTGFMTTASVEGRTRAINLNLTVNLVADSGSWVAGSSGPTGADLGVVASHAALLPGKPGQLDDTKVIFFGYNEDDYNDEDKGEYQLWDPATRAPFMPAPPPIIENFAHHHSPFCSGHAYLANGDLLVVGGHIAYDLYDGGPAAKAVHRVRRSPAVEFMADWIDLPGMEHDRWYPTAVTLASGKVLFLGGSSQYLDNPWNGTNEDFELFSSTPIDHLLRPFRELARDPYTFERDEPSTPGRDERHTSAFGNFPSNSRVVGLYSHAHILPANSSEGLVYVMTEFIGRVYDPVTNTYLQVPASDPAAVRTMRVDVQGYRTWHNQGASVLLPIDILPSGATPAVVRIMHIGGGTMGRNDPRENARTDAVVVRYDVASRNLTLETFVELGERRFMGDGVLLPTGEVLVVNGAEEGYTNNNSYPVFRPTLIRSDRSTSGADMPVFVVKDPAEPPATTERRYHSSSCLLPDGAVVIAGSSGGWTPGDNEKFNVEVYQPWYFGCQERPQLVSWPAQLQHGSTFTVEANTRQLQSFVVLLRFSSVTHSLNTDQRLLRLHTNVRRQNSLTVTLPHDRTIAPPGPYLLYVIDTAGFPSHGKVVLIA